MIVESCMQHGEKHDHWLINISGQNLDNNTGNNNSAWRGRLKTWCECRCFETNWTSTSSTHLDDTVQAAWRQVMFIMLLFLSSYFFFNEMRMWPPFPPIKVQNGYVE